MAWGTATDSPVVTVAPSSSPALAAQSWGIAIRPKPESACPHCRDGKPTRTTEGIVWHPDSAALSLCLSDAHTAAVHARVSKILGLSPASASQPQQPASTGWGKTV